MKRFLSFLLLLLFSARPMLADTLVETSRWMPPDLTGLTSASPVELRVLAVAQREVGYTLPSNKPSKYSLWYGNGGSPWCSEFVAWCASQCDKYWKTNCLSTLFPRTDTSTSTAMYYLRHNRYIGAHGYSFDGERQWLCGATEYLNTVPYLPTAGDVVWFRFSQGQDPMDHTALVEGVSQDEAGSVWVHVIEGNMESSVRRHAYALHDEAIVAYGTPTVRAYTVLDEGSRYGDVNKLRRELLSLGYTAAKSSISRLTGRTLQALHAFQRDHCLPEGALTLETRQALDQALKENAP